MRLFVYFIFIPILMIGLTSCSSVKDRDRVGVIEAKSCVKQKQSNSVILDIYKIKACANNGIWLVENTETNERFDFLNKLFTSAQNETISFSDLNDDDRASAMSLQKKINAELLDSY